MRRLFTFFVPALLAVSVFAQAPQSMSYQAVVRNASNALVANTQVGMQISILQGTSSGTATYVETQTPTTNANGLVSITIGGGTLVSGTFANINWAIGSYFIKTETDPTGGTNYTITGTSQLLSVPYSLYAQTAGNVIGGSSGFTHYVGEQFGGGIVFFVYKDSSNAEHGLIVSLTDLAGNVSYWGTCTSCVLSTWNGIANTNAMIAAGSVSSSAAGLCNSYSGGGFTDWYLPSLAEFILLFNNTYLLNKNNRPNSSYIELTPQSFYWLSTDDGVAFSTYLGTTYDFSGGYTVVRAIRAY